MPDAELLSSLVGQIYDAALDPILWPAALGQLAGFVGGSAASLYSKNASGKSIDIYYDDGGLDPVWIDRYRDEYVKCDPSTVRQFFAGVGQSVATSDFMPYGEFRDTKFSAEWAEPQYLIDGITAVLEKSGPTTAMFTVFRETGDGRIDEATRRRMDLIAPHIRRAAAVTETLASSTGRAMALSDVLDTVTAGVLLVDAGGAVVHANAAGRAALGAGRLFHRPVDRLSALDAEADRALVALLASLSGGILAGNSAAIPIRASDGELYVAHALPLAPRPRESGLPVSAVLALFVRRASFGGIAAPEAIAKAFRLTPTELRVLLGIVEVGGAPEVADALGIAESTVKFHLRRLFEKTGVHRQADLVKLVAGFSSAEII